MIKYSLAIASFFFVYFSAFGQCEDCKTVEGFTAEYCFTSATISDKCAQFSAETGYFYFQPTLKKPGKKLPLTTEPTNAQLIALAGDKKLKISALDILFLQEAITAWNTQLIASQVTAATAAAKGKIYTAEELSKLEFEQQASGLGMLVLQEGKGPKPKAGQRLEVHYRGYLAANGNVFDASYDRGQPFAFSVGKGQVIKGWDIGMGQLPVGSRALIKLPPEIAYGQRNLGTIPANSTLIFDVVVMGAN